MGPSGGRWRGVLALFAAVLVAVGLHVLRVDSKETFTYDEPTSYLISTCHVKEYWERIYVERPPFGERVEAGDLQRYMHPEEEGAAGSVCPRVIGEGMGIWAVHPPLYFWALNAWVATFGVDVQSGPAMNVIFAVLTMLAIAGLALRLFGSWPAAVFTAFIWGVGPTALELTSEARMYSLYSLIGVLFIWQAVRLADAAPERRGLQLALLGAISFIGALTHYHFLLLIPAGLALILWRAWPRWMRVVQAAGAIAAGCVLSYLVHPHFFNALEASRGEGGVGPTEFWDRTERTLASLGNLIVGPDIGARTGYEYVAAGVVIAVALVALGYALWRRDRKSAAVIPALFALIVTPMIFLYVSGESPPAAMGLKYLAVALPFLLFAPALLLTRLPRGPRLAGAAAIAAGFLGLGLYTATNTGQWEDDTGDFHLLPAETVAGTDLLVIDSAAWNLVARAVWHLPPDQPVLAASQEHLTGTDRWVDEVGPDTSYLATYAFTNTEELSGRISRRIAEAAGSPMRSIEERVVYGEVFRTEP